VLRSGGGGGGAAADVVALEAWVDEDPGLGHGIPIAVAPGQETTAVVDLDLSAETIGFHVLHVRARSADGLWSHGLSQPVLLLDNTPPVVEPVAAFRWRFAGPGVDPLQTWSVAVGAPAEEVEATFEASTAALSEGEAYVLHLWAEAESGVRGLEYRLDLVEHRTPQHLRLSWSEGTVRLDWDAVPGADSYAVYGRAHDAPPGAVFAPLATGLDSAWHETAEPAPAAFYRATATRDDAPARPVAAARRGGGVAPGR